MVDCGMLTFGNEYIHGLIKKNLSVSADEIDFQPFNKYFSRFVFFLL